MLIAISTISAFYCGIGIPTIGRHSIEGRFPRCHRSIELQSRAFSVWRNF